MYAGQRWRCLQYLIRRARLNLALLEQLDLVGRTGELARTFGIDFFSVLSRGSQYRVESMMVRLAHTQNYLMASPSKEQVSNALGCVAAGSRQEVRCGAKLGHTDCLMLMHSLVVS